METDLDLVALKKRRKIIKGSCTRIKTYVDTIATITPPVIAQLEERRCKLNDYWSEYGDIQSQIELLDENETNDRALFEESYYALSARIREFLNPITHIRATTASPSTSRASDQMDTQINIRLPKLNLPTFSGKYHEWFPFFDSFNSVIHLNASISSVQKLQYLKASLTGDAGNVISSLEISDLNYEVAWNLLRERYDNKRVIVRTHIKAIMELPSMVKENSAELRRIADGAVRHIQALQALKRPTAHWDDLLVYILSSKLDATTLREWQSSLVGTDPPTFKQFSDFITHRCQILEATGSAVDALSKGGNKRFQANAKRQTACVATINPKCNFCNGEHAIYYCKNFLALSVPQRIIEVRNRRICINCLRSPSHSANKCPSRGCKLCKIKHNTLLHQNESTTETITKETNIHDDSVATKPSTTLVACASNNNSAEHVMLSTAVVNAFHKDGSAVSCRALLDCGSQANFISRDLVKALGLSTHPLNVSISGINRSASSSTQATGVKLQSRLNTYTIEIECIITDQITGNLPTFTMRRDVYKIPRNLNLADPQFNVSSRIDILIGVEKFWDLLCVGQIKHSPEHPTLQKTHFGWILAGRLCNSLRSVRKVHSMHATVTNSQLHHQLSRFWQIEDVNTACKYTAEELNCEKHFLENVSQTHEGRYIVKLPIKQTTMANLGNSREIAIKRLQALERRLSRDPNLKTQYTNFISEYLNLGHMKRVDIALDGNTPAYYLPHHCVFKGTKQASKIRVVFDASCKSSSGISLNDALRVGPTVQQDLMSIVMRFRTFVYVLVADIVKMYRQVLVHPSQTRLQRILWRDQPSSDIETYELITLTYGTSSASYLATRCLNHLAELHASDYPIGSARVHRDFYVDDLLTGANTIEEAETARDEIIKILSLGSFQLSKWASNCSQLLGSINGREDPLIPISDGNESYVLGLRWDQTNDTFHFPYGSEANHGTITKRVILSEISKLFDPLGLLGPIIVVAKLILQDLWKSGAHWDESVPQATYTRWSTLKSQLLELNRLTVPRQIKFGSSQRDVQIHGFCDASQNAYGACVYIRSRLKPDEYRSELLCSKSRIAPLKAVSLPRLELCAALLLARLVEKIQSAINTTDVQIYLWSDSTITLNWISSPSRKWSVFVANRVGEIQRLTKAQQWHHISTTLNPADLLSRGLNPRELINNDSWWHGPRFLCYSEDRWPSCEFPCLGDNAPELRRVCVAVAVLEINVIEEILSRHSDLNKICRIVAYCLRIFKKRPRPPTLFISHEESDAALNQICKMIQQQHFSSEYKALVRHDVISSTSKILSLTPFLDEIGLLRVGGRLRNSDLTFNSRHPILLPANHELTKRIIMREHVRNMHAGTQATMAAIRQQFWPLSLRSTARKIILHCVKCFRVKPAFSEATMGSLPTGRVTVSRPFSHCGVDYAGPIILRESKRRNARNHKAYVALFVCFAVKAVHIELVSDLTSDAFIAALKRFISRRGKPSHVYSDNGTNFVGAHNQLKEFFDNLSKNETQEEVKHFLRTQQTSWNFIPPNAPHFGGLWEAAVKSAKYHMNRIIGKAHLTFEELQTILCEIEAVLNSRPITALSSDPNDLSFLSPGHFLIGTTMNGFPCYDLRDINENRLVRWQRVEQLRQHFWQRWSGEYLHSLQTRSKWKADKGVQLETGQLVLIRQQDLAPLHWLLGRVHEIHAGADGIVRSATVRTAKGFLTRPLTKLAILPIETSDVRC